MGELVEVKTTPGEAVEVAERAGRAGVNIRSCYQCGKCTAGCPVAHAMDYGPRQIARMLQLGMLEDAINSHSIWLCAACETCSARCPRSVEPAKMMDWLRVEAGKRGAVAEKNIKLFNDSFLKLVKKYGRVHELELIITYNLKSRQPFKDAELGPEMMKRGKLHLMPHRIKGIGTLRRIFQKTEGGEGH
ncbi:MAG: 4Fe-4S dicluster domain-containing protein [Syntrophomonadaceae bacterium]|nr:4Fe-4S dicluster domain-containing protein [Syntrophomonadaceae bacterium]